MKTALPAVLGSIDNPTLVQAAEDRFALPYKTDGKFSKSVLSRFFEKYISLRPLCLCGEIIPLFFTTRFARGTEFTESISFFH